MPAGVHSSAPRICFVPIVRASWCARGRELRYKSSKRPGSCCHADPRDGSIREAVGQLGLDKGRASMATTKPDADVRVQHQGTVESVSVATAGVDRLKPNAVGLMGVIFVAVTGAAPISAMLFNVPFATGFGTGLYTPAAFLFATIILTIFSIGYVAMARKIRAAGGFYSFISHGLGRELGMATGITGALAYCLFEVSLLGGFAYFANTNFNDWFGWDIPWPLFAFGAALLISVLCYFDVELSVRVLGVALIGELIILAIFDILVFGQGGKEGIQASSLNVFQLT